MLIQGSHVTPCKLNPQQPIIIDVEFDTESSVSLTVTMGTTMSEPCIYDKLSESIDILRQSGYRYGMSEREIERLIKQVLETNEPRREPPEFPILRATIKVVLSLCLSCPVELYSFDTLCWNVF